MEPSNYWRRRLFLQKFDERASGAFCYPWKSYFGEIKERLRMKIRTPEQFWKVSDAARPTLRLN
jgi:hypothetical protein